MIAKCPWMAGRVPEFLAVVSTNVPEVFKTLRSCNEGINSPNEKLLGVHK